MERLSNWFFARRRSDNSGWTGSLFNFHLVIFHEADSHAVFDIDIKNFYIEENQGKSFDIEFLFLHIETFSIT